MALRAAISALHARLVAPDPLDVEARLAAIAERFQHRLRRRPPAVPDPEPTIADQLREYLDGHLTGDVTLKDAAQLLDRSIAHLVRSFTRRYRISPHAYVIGARVDLARKLLLQGMPPARVAVDTGFHDQAHLTRHFTRHVSVPPARYAASFTRFTVAEDPDRS
ncbi:AraC family transcriptional regulator [Actinoplanes sp. M2I2]|uniref:helix-turn-helix domain-containing protein n=1 Tax=Actinoplanes sp. M2I2 TaxID=1734444 RepID=UPI002021B017|nr:AraC family transcriptional regulator [Actinoplanes sp. M2I2]